MNNEQHIYSHDFCEFISTYEHKTNDELIEDAKFEHALTNHMLYVDVNKYLTLDMATHIRNDRHYVINNLHSFTNLNDEIMPLFHVDFLGF